MTTVTMYSKDYCPYCKAAKSLLDDKGISYREIDVEHNPAELETMIARSGRRTVPQVFFDNDHVARISLDGGRTWADGTSDGTPALAKAKKFSLVPAYRDVGKMDHYSNALAATVQLPSGSYLTLCRYKRDKILKGRIWHLESRGEE